MRPVLEDSYVDVVERLFREFEGHHLLSVISDVVAECRDQLKGETPITAFPEMLERWARQRLTDLPTTHREHQRTG